MEAGNRCFDDRVPEEVNRRIIDHISDINLPYTEHARRYLLAEGIRAETVIKTGSPMKEVLNAQKASIDASRALATLSLKARKYFIASMHREENVDDESHLSALLAALEAASGQYDMPVIVSTHPRTRKRVEELKTTVSERIQFLKPFGFADYVRLQKDAFCVLSDSGTITEEASLLGFPAVMLREAHERPEGMDEGTLIMSGTRASSILDAVAAMTARHARGGQVSRAATDYDVDNVSSKVVNVILSYTDYVNRTVWRK